MVVRSIENPDRDDVEDLLTESLNTRQVVVMFTHCEVEYDGRASGYLGVGDRIVICKPDGTLLVHRPRNHNPVNWQPPGSVIRVTTLTDQVHVTARRSNPTEHVTVILHDTYHVSTFEADDGAPLELSGTEADLHDRVLQNPDVIEEGLRVIEHERATPHGSIDIFANDRDGQPVIIEVKRRQAALTHVDQLIRYVSLYAESNPDARGILAAPGASEKVKRTLRDNGLEFAQIDLFAERSDPGRSTTISDFQ